MEVVLLEVQVPAVLNSWKQACFMITKKEEKCETKEKNMQSGTFGKI